jgi:hypothetical protein
MVSAAIIAYLSEAAVAGMTKLNPEQGRFPLSEKIK